MKVGDLVKGVSDRYGITNKSMTKAVVTKILGDDKIEIEILEHAGDSTGSFFVNPQHFEVIGETKPFDRDVVIELLKNGCKKEILEYNLRRANLRRANLRRADLSDADLSDATLAMQTLIFRVFHYGAADYALRQTKD